jgi:hypothetical protein
LSRKGPGVKEVISNESDLLVLPEKREAKADVEQTQKRHDLWVLMELRGRKGDGCTSDSHSNDDELLLALNALDDLRSEGKSHRVLSRLTWARHD